MLCSLIFTFISGRDRFDQCCHPLLWHQQLAQQYLHSSHYCEARDMGRMGSCGIKCKKKKWKINCNFTNKQGEGIGGCLQVWLFNFTRNIVNVLGSGLFWVITWSALSHRLLIYSRMKPNDFATQCLLGQFPYGCKEKQQRATVIVKITSHCISPSVYKPTLRVHECIWSGVDVCF